MNKILIPLLLLFAISSYAQEKTLAEKLGYSKTDKLLIIHADDIGLAHSENAATIQSMTKGIVNSTSIMMPAPWATEVGEMIQDRPDLDIGVHITLTNEWFNYKWRPVAPTDKVSGLIGENSFMYFDCASVTANATPEEVEIEMRAQIEAAIKIGIKPTHLDAHMGCVFFGKPEYLASFLKLAKEYQLPAMINPQMMEGIIKANPRIFSEIDVDNLVVIDRILMATPQDYDAKGMEEFYTETLNNLQAGVNVLLVHVAFDDAEMRAITTRHPYFHAAWRQADFDFFTSEKAKKLLQYNNIKLVTWREIGKFL